MTEYEPGTLATVTCGDHVEALYVKCDCGDKSAHCKTCGMQDFWPCKTRVALAKPEGGTDD